MKNIVTLLGLFICFCTGLFAQTGKFYGLRESSGQIIFCKIDTAGNKIADISTLPIGLGVAQGVTSCDAEHGRYFFCSYSKTGVYNFYAVDVNTGKIVTEMAIPSWAKPIQMAFNKANSKIYAIIPAKEHIWLASLDTIHDTIVKIDSLEGHPFTVQGAYGIDSKHGQFYFLGMDKKGNHALYIINLSNASIYKKIMLNSPNFMTDIQYDEKLDRYYGVRPDSANSHKSYLAFLDGGKPYNIDSMAGVNAIAQGVSCYDAEHGRYFLHSNGLVTVNVKNADVLNKVSIKGTGLFDFQYFGTTAPPVANILKGEMAISTGKALKYSKMYLCTYNANDSIVKVIDSMVTDSGGHYTFNVHDTTVYLLAFPNATLYPNELPTWADASTDFTYSNRIFIHSGTNFKHYKTIYGANTGGSGFVGGKIVYCYACKTFGSGNPAWHIRVILSDSNGKAQAYTYTDAAGNFSFNNIAIDKYKIVIDLPNMNNSIAPVINLSSSAASLKNLSFTLFPTYLYLDKNSGIESKKGIVNNIQISPNPFTNSIRLRSEILNAEKITISISDLTGREVYHSNISLMAGNSDFQLTDLSFKGGMYFVRIQGENREQVVKMLKTE